MKMKVYLASVCVLALTGFSTLAQQQKMLSIIDTTYVPVANEIPVFPNYDHKYQVRLESIQKMVPLTYNEHVQKYIDIYAGRKEMMGKMLGLSEYYFPIFEAALKSQDIPEEIKYLPIIESSMNPHAVSRVGATGLWQFMFATAKGYGLSINSYVDERKDPLQASNAAAAYFKDAYDELGDWLLALAAYNCGRGNVNRAIAKADSRDFWEIRKYLPMETRNYVPAFIAAVYVMNYSSDHEIKAQKSTFLQNTDIIQVNRTVSLASLAGALNIDLDQLSNLNPSFKKKIVNGTEESPKCVILPKVNLASFTQVYNLLNDEANTKKQVVLASNKGSGVHEIVEANKPSIFYHKVKTGQNLSVIADKYNVEVQDLKVWNNLKSSSILPGQRLKIYHHVDSKDVVDPIRS